MANGLRAVLLEAPADPHRAGPLVIYGHYRILLAAALLALFVVGLDRAMRLGTYQPALYLGASIVYFVTCIATTFGTRLLLGRDRIQGLILTGVDIVALTVLAHASGGPSSNVAPLLVVTVAAGAILLPGRLGLLPAAVAALGMLYEHFYFSMSRGLPLSSGSTQVGLLGIAFFGVAIATSRLARLLQDSEALARRRKEQITALEELNAHIIQRMRTGITVVDTDGQMLLINNAARQLLACDPKLPEKPPLKAISPILADRISDWRAHGPAPQSVFQHQAGGPQLSANMTPITIGGMQAVLVFIEDMTALGQNLQQMKLASLGRLAASIAHEIRNPLAAISHAAQLLNEATGLGKEDRRLVEIVQQQSLRLDRIVENVLQLSRRQAPRTELFDLAAWLQQFRKDYLDHHGNGDELGVHVANPGIRVRFDSAHLQQVLQNLCDNGLRHGRKLRGQGKVLLAAGIDAHGGEPWLRIADNGPGIPDEQLPSLFEPFYTTETGGTGLGLYIARELCEANRARLAYISAKSAPDGTPCFMITFSHPARLAS